MVCGGVWWGVVGCGGVWWGVVEWGGAGVGGVGVSWNQDNAVDH